MNTDMTAFLSEGALREHKEYLAFLKHKASILEKSGVDINTLTRKDSSVPSVRAEERRSLAALKHSIDMHEMYFDSFSAQFIPCPAIKMSFGSENSFAYEATKICEGIEQSFLCVYTSRSGRIGLCDARSLPLGARNLLCIDLYEHAYFKDYGFKKEKYVRAALAHLNFKKINDAFGR